MHAHGIRVFGVTVVLCLSTSCSSAQTPARERAATPTVLSAKDAPARAAEDPNAQRYDVFRNLDPMTPGERRKALVLILRGRNPRMAEEAAVRLMEYNLDDPELALIRDRIAGWSEHAQSLILSRIADRVHPPAPFVALARSLLDMNLAQPGELPMGGYRRTAEYGAMIIAQNGGPEDLPRIRAALRRQPNSPTLWHAVTATGGASGPDGELARRTYSDESKSEFLRVAAAMSIASNDPQALGFVVERVERTLTELADKDQITLYAGVRSYEDMGAIDQQLAPRLGALSALGFLPLSVAEPFMRRALGAKNEFIRDSAAVAAALRSPNLLIDERPPGIAPERFELLLAVAVHRDPSFAARAEKALGRPLSAEANERVKRGGLSLFPWVGNLVGGL